VALLHDQILEKRNALIEAGRPVLPDSFGGVDKTTIRSVLSQVNLSQPDLVDAVFALLDDGPSWFKQPPATASFNSGAATAHIACHVGILQRGGSKLDREGRDTWIKPLREIGAVEPVTLLATNGDRRFVVGHVVSKSGNTSYRLARSFVDILRAPPGDRTSLFQTWLSADHVRQRRELEATLTEQSRQLVGTGHSQLINASITNYLPRFLPGFQVIYVDDGDGDRVTNEDRENLSSAGVQLTLADAMPDVLCWNPTTDWLWVIEAVTSDGEVDFHKVNQVREMAQRCGKAGVGFTTTYLTWLAAARRQGNHRNLAIGSFMWILADPSRQFYVGTFTTVAEESPE